MKLSILLSFFNEEDLILESIDRFDQVAKKLRKTGLKEVEVIIIDDASTDRSWQKLQTFEPKNLEIKAFKTAVNIGVTDSFILALQKSTGNYLVYMDCDLQDPPELIIDLLTKIIAENLDVVHTRRVRRMGEGYFKRSITWLGYRVIRYISESKIPADCGDFKLFNSKIKDRILSFDERLIFLRHIFSLVGGRQGFVDYIRDGRADGAGKSKMAMMSNKVLDYWFFRALGSTGTNSLKLILIFGSILIALSIFSVMIIVAMKYLNFLVPGTASIIIVSLVLGALNIFFLGLASIYIGIIAHETKKRPRFFLEDEAELKLKDGDPPKSKNSK